MGCFGSKSSQEQRKYAANGQIIIQNQYSLADNKSQNSNNQRGQRMSQYIQENNNIDEEQGDYFFMKCSLQQYSFKQYKDYSQQSNFDQLFNENQIYYYVLENGKMKGQISYLNLKQTLFDQEKENEKHALFQNRSITVNQIAIKVDDTDNLQSVKNLEKLKFIIKNPELHSRFLSRIELLLTKNECLGAQNIQEKIEKSKQNVPKTFQFYDKNMIYLQKLAEGGQGSISIVYNLQQQQMFVCKKFLEKEAYFHEKNMYKLVEQKKMQHMFLPIVEYNDDEQILIMKRGAGDLQQFSIIKRDFKSPVSLQETFYLLETLAKYMKILSDNGIYLVDLKGQNVLVDIVNINNELGYKIFLTDLGAAYYIHDPKQFYLQMSITKNYFDQRKLENFEIFYSEQKEQYIIESEIFVLARTIQSIICVSFNCFNLFNNDATMNQVTKFKQFISHKKDIIGEELVLLLTNMIVHLKYDNFDALIKEIEFQHQKFLKRNNLAEKSILLTDKDDYFKKDMNKRIQKYRNMKEKSDLELEQEVLFYNQYYLYQEQGQILKEMLDRLQNQNEKATQTSQQVRKFEKSLTDLYNKLGANFLYQGNLNEAKYYFNQTLEIQKNEQNSTSKTNNQEKLGYATSLNNLAIIQFKQNSFEDASVKFQQSYEILKNIYGDQDIQLGTILNNIGVAMQKQKKYSEAISYYSQCYELKTKFFGENHIKLASILNNLGITNSLRKQYQKAQEYYFKCLEIQQNYYGDNHIKLTTTYMNIGLGYQQTNNYKEAEANLNICLEIQQKCLGNNNIFVASTINSLGKLYLDQQKYEEALKNFQTSLNIHIKHNGETHLKLASIYINIGTAQKILLQLKEALSSFLKAYEILQKNNEKDKIDIIQAFHKIAQIYYLLQQKTESLEYYEKCFDLTVQIFGKSANNIKAIYNEIKKNFTEEELKPYLEKHKLIFQSQLK